MTCGRNGRIRAPRAAIRDHGPHGRQQPRRSGARARTPRPTAIRPSRSRLPQNQGPFMVEQSEFNPINNQARTDRDPDPPPTTKRAIRGTVCRHLYRRCGPTSTEASPDLHHGRRDGQHDVALRYSDAARHPHRPSTPRSAVSVTIFDRNLNSNTRPSGLTFPPRSSQYDQRRPARSLFSTVTVDVNSVPDHTTKLLGGHVEYPLHPVRQAHARRSQSGEGDRDDPRSDLHGPTHLHPPERQYRSL